jgi:hypothetical protein
VKEVVKDSYLFEVTNAGCTREEMETRYDPFLEGQLSIDRSAEGWCDRLTIGQPPREEEDQLPFEFSGESLMH